MILPVHTTIHFQSCVLLTCSMINIVPNKKHKNVAKYIAKYGLSAVGHPNISPYLPAAHTAGSPTLPAAHAAGSPAWPPARQEKNAADVRGWHRRHLRSGGFRVWSVRTRGSAVWSVRT